MVTMEDIGIFLTLLTCCVLVTVNKISCQEFDGFDHNVIAKCLPEDKVCEFELNIELKRNMVVYGRPEGSKLARDNGRLLKVENGELLVHNNSNCGVFTKATESEIKKAITADGENGFLYTINGQFPGPTLTVYEGQEVAVKVTNSLYQESLTIHWHGMRQKHTNWMDGVPTVTQCAITPQQSFMYRFIASPKGTHWYHSHEGAQRSDGMYGALVVLPHPTQNKVKTGKEDHYTSKDFVVLVQDKFPLESKHEFHNFYNGMSQGETACYKPDVQADGTTIAPLEYYSALINGKGFPLSKQIPGLPIEKFDVRYGLTYRFRLINPGLLYTFKFCIDQHSLKVVASDGNDLVPITADAVYVTPGERYDVLVKADQPLQSYWIRMETLHWDLSNQLPTPQYVTAILDYSTSQQPTSTKRACTREQPCVHINCPFQEFPQNQYISCIHLEDLQSKEKSNIKKPADKEVFLNFHYANSTDGGIRSAINGIQHLPASVSTDTYPDKVFEYTCDTQHCANGRPCRCTNQLELASNQVIHMVFFTQMWYAESGTDLPALIGSSHPVHMHGHHFEVIKVGYPQVDPVTKRYKSMASDIKCNNDACNKASWRDINSFTSGMNLVNPPIKDTVHVPAGGYVVVRYVTDNPGYWMLHCHIENHNLEGMAMIVKEGSMEEMTSFPPNFPQCGSFHLSEEDFRNSMSKIVKPDSVDYQYYVLVAVIVIMCIALVTLSILLYKAKVKARHQDVNRSQPRFRASYRSLDRQADIGNENLFGNQQLEYSNVHNGEVTTPESKMDGAQSVDENKKLLE